MNSVIIPFNRDNSNIIELNHDIHCKDMVHSQSFYLKNTNNVKHYTLLMHLFYLYQ